MNPYAEEEEVEILKKWWQANGTAVIAGIIIGLVAVFGWRYWTAYQNSQAENASSHYDAFVHALDGADADQARQRGQALIDDFPNSIYAVLTALKLAKLAADKNDNPAAITNLEWAAAHAKQAEIKDIVHLRLAHLLLTQGQLDTAAAQLEQIKNPTFNAEVEELKGDLYLARNEPDKARTAYEAALGAGSGSGFLPLKLNSLTPPTAQEK